MGLRKYKMEYEQEVDIGWDSYMDILTIRGG